LNTSGWPFSTSSKQGITARGGGPTASCELGHPLRNHIAGRGADQAAHSVLSFHVFAHVVAAPWVVAVEHLGGQRLCKSSVLAHAPWVKKQERKAIGDSDYNRRGSR